MIRINNANRRDVYDPTPLTAENLREAINTLDYYNYRMIRGENQNAWIEIDEYPNVDIRDLMNTETSQEMWGYPEPRPIDGKGWLKWQNNRTEYDRRNKKRQIAWCAEIIRRITAGRVL